MTEISNSEKQVGQNAPIRVLLVDDQVIVRQVMRRQFADVKDIIVVGEAGDGQTALTQAFALQPDIVVMDIKMPNMDGLAATRALREVSPQTAVLIHTSFEDINFLREAVGYGAAGYILKGLDQPTLLKTLRDIHEGGSAIEPHLLSEILRDLREQDQEKSTKKNLPVLVPLTPREEHVLDLVSQGYNNKNIAATLCISIDTVKSHIKVILSKLNVGDRTQAALLAVRYGYGK